MMLILSVYYVLIISTSELSVLHVLINLTLSQ